MRSNVVSTAEPSFTLMESPPEARAISGEPAQVVGPLITVGPPDPGTVGGVRRGPKITPPNGPPAPGHGVVITGGPVRPPPPVGKGPSISASGAKSTIKTASALSSAAKTRG